MGALVRVCGEFCRQGRVVVVWLLWGLLIFVVNGCAPLGDAGPPPSQTYAEVLQLEMVVQAAVGTTADLERRGMITPAAGAHLQAQYKRTLSYLTMASQFLAANDPASAASAAGLAKQTFMIIPL